jgi:hypothetical protein
MTALSRDARAALVALAAVSLSLAPSAARADDTVRVCIAASTNGQLFRKQGKLLASRDEFIACARDACPAIVRSHCARWLSEVEAALPSIVVRAEDAGGGDAIGVRLSIDGRPGKLDGQPVRLDPGEHTVAIENDHGAKKEEHLLLVEGEASRHVTLRLPPEPGAVARREPPPPGPPDTLRRKAYVPAGAWILGGAGILAFGGATYFGLAAKQQLNDLQSCSPHCLDSQTQTGRTDALVFDILLGVGGAAVAGALVWALAFPAYSTTSASSARIDVRPLAGGAMTALTVSY